MGTGRACWYIFGEIGQGQKDGQGDGQGGGRRPKTVCLGPFLGQNEAQTAANKIVDWLCDTPEPIRLFTSDLQKAKQIYKAKMSQSSGQLGISLRPIHSANTKKASRFERIKESRGIE
jgi:hypothetical protein